MKRLRLLPCPFCGNAQPDGRSKLSWFAGPRVMVHGPSPLMESFRVECPCGASMGRFDNPRSAAREWNRRANA